jgi:hypothetical protein
MYYCLLWALKGVLLFNIWALKGGYIDTVHTPKGWGRYGPIKSVGLMLPPLSTMLCRAWTVVVAAGAELEAPIKSVGLMLPPLSTMLCRAWAVVVAAGPELEASCSHIATSCSKMSVQPDMMASAASSRLLRELTSSSGRISAPVTDAAGSSVEKGLAGAVGCASIPNLRIENTPPPRQSDDPTKSDDPTISEESEDPRGNTREIRGSDNVPTINKTGWNNR